MNKIRLFMTGLCLASTVVTLSSCIDDDNTIRQVVYIEDGEATIKANMTSYKTGGYKLVANDKVYTSSSKEMSPTIDYVNANIYYSNATGVFYKKDKNGDYAWLSDEMMQQQATLDIEHMPMALEFYNNYNAGGIYNLDEHFDEFYSHYNVTILSEKTYKYVSKYDQTDLSCYMQGVSSEGNCGLVSTYNALQFGQFTEKFSLMPPVTETTFYTSFMDGSLYRKQILNQENYVDITLDSPASFPLLYIQARQKSLVLNNSVESLTYFQSANIYTDVLKDYGYNVKSYSSVFYATEKTISSVVRAIDEGYGCLLSMVNGFYPNHSTAVVGYKKYQMENKESNELKNVFILELADGHRKNTMYFDLSIFSYGGLGALIWFS